MSRSEVRIMVKVLRYLDWARLNVGGVTDATYGAFEDIVREAERGQR